MKKRIFAIVCVLIWLILIAPVVTPYIKTLFIHDGMMEYKVFDIMDHVWDLKSSGSRVDDHHVTLFEMPMGQKFGLTWQSTGGKEWLLVNHFGVTPGDIPVWLFATAVTILYTLLIALAMKLAVGVFSYFRKNMY